MPSPGRSVIWLPCEEAGVIYAALLVAQLLSKLPLSSLLILAASELAAGGGGHPLCPSVVLVVCFPIYYSWEPVSWLPKNPVVCSGNAL